MRTKLITTCLLLIATATSARAAQTDVHLEVLKQHGISPDAASISSYLRAMFPGATEYARMEQLVSRLGNDDFFTRETAMQELLRLPVVSNSLLEEAIKTGDPEIRWRAKRVMDQTDAQRADVLYAVLRTIHKHKIAGLAEPLFAVIPLCKSDYMRVAARDAIRVSASTDDAKLVEQHLSAEDANLRIAAIGTLSVVLPDTYTDKAFGRLDDKDQRVGVAAARILANAGDRRCLAPLADMLDADEIRVRVDAVKLLRGLRGEQFGFTAYEKPEKRKDAVASWRKWVEGDGKTAKLNFPLKETVYDVGRILVCCYGQNKIVELDLTGKQVWEKQCGQHPWGCQGLPNGHRLVATYSDKKVAEWDTSGKVVWEYSGLPGGPMSVQRLENGNTLIACSDSQKVLEVTHDKKVAWEVTITGRPTCATRLENGNTLVALQNGNRVVEVDRSGKVVWEISGINNAIAAQRLENGNTVVSSSVTKKVMEFDQNKKEVWSAGGFSNAYDVHRLPNGNTLVADSTGVREIDRSGKEIWKWQSNGISRISRY